jgi:transcriptional regulator with XRE-family HTH domain
MFRIKEILKEQGKTMQNLADMLKINRVTLSSSISGNPTIETLQRIAAALGVNILDLFEDTRNREPAQLTCPHCKESISIDIR